MDERTKRYAPDVTEQDKSKTTPAESTPPQSTTEKKPTTKPGGSAKPRRRGASGYLILILLLVIAAGAAAGYYGFRYYQQLTARLDALALQQTQTELENAKLKSQLAEDLQTLSKQQADLSNDIQVLQRRSHFVRKDWLVMESEYLLQLANYRLLFERDTKTALVALKAADSRLRETGDPGLIGVRKAISESEQALAAVPQIDLAGLSLNISTLVKEIDNPPLATPDPKSKAQEQKHDGSETAKVKSWSGLPAAIWHDMKHLVVIRDHSQPVEPLLAPDQRFFLSENLRLQLEQARLAMLSGQAGVYKERIDKAIQWIRLYFDPDSPLTQSVLANLEKLQSRDIAPPLPDISKPYQMLERFRAQQSMPESKPVPETNAK